MNEIFRHYFREPFNDFVQSTRCPQLVAALVDSQGRTQLYTHGFQGLELDYEYGDVQFRIASMTKCFAAAMVLILRDRGVLDIMAPISNFISGLRDPRWTSVSVRDLLTMQSGLPTDDAWGDRVLSWSEDELLSTIRGELYFCSEPRKEFHYSNLGYMLVGLVVSAVTGTSALEAIREHVLTPLGMTRTDWAPASSGWLSGTVSRHDELKSEPDLGACNSGAVFGGLWSTANDLARWMRFLWGDVFSGIQSGGEILSLESRAELQSGVVPVPLRVFSKELGPLSRYALGLAHLRTGDTEIVCHSGGLPGYGSHFCWNLESKVGVVALANVRYAALEQPCQRALVACLQLKTSKVKTEKSTPEKFIVQTRADQLVGFIMGESLKEEEIFASNFFLDNQREDLDAEVKKVRCLFEHRELSEIHIVLEYGLSARIYISDQPIVWFLLSPAEGAKIQDMKVLI